MNLLLENGRQFFLIKILIVILRLIKNGLKKEDGIN